MTTFGTMQTRIRRELNRDGLTAEIKAAVQSAIEMLEEDDFWFLDGEISASASASAEAILMPTNLQDIRRIELSASSTIQEPLLSTHFDEIRNRNAGVETFDEPTDYALFRDRIYFYPKPDQNYKLRIFGKRRFTEVSASASANATNVWMTDGERLVRYASKADIYANKLRNEQAAAGQELLAAREKSTLIGKTTDRRATRRVKRHM